MTLSTVTLAIKSSANITDARIRCAPSGSGPVTDINRNREREIARTSFHKIAAS